MATKAQGKGTDAGLAMRLIAGTNKHFANTSSLAFASATFTPAQVTASLQTIVNLRTDVDTAKALTKAKVAAERTQTPTLRSFMAAFESFVRATFGNSPDVLADFGLTKKARTPLTVEAKAAAAAKRKATRAARHTMGAQQKKSVKGAVTGIVVTPVTAAQPVATTPAGPIAPATSTGTTAGSTPHTT
jgi:hypothetical protein